MPPLVAPPPVSWWPPAPGWWLLLFALLALMIAALRWGRPRWQNYLRHRERVRAFQHAIQNALQHYFSDADSASYLYRVNRALRKLLLQAGEKSLLMQSASVAWLQALDALSGRPGLDSDTGRQLLLQYHAQPDLNAGQLHAALLAWSNNLRSANPGSRQRNANAQRPVRLSPGAKRAAL
ncbi:MAG: DUF4381 domain-containing protein [Pseudomonadales bacterium]|nr:DUF4381 domain-containing protein [Pseudomonadales bacterium]